MVLRYYSTVWFDLTTPIDPFRNYHWLLVVIMPFGPILLDLQGFYQSPLNKTKWKSFVQILRAMIDLSIIVSGCVIFLRFPSGEPIGATPLYFDRDVWCFLIKERIIVDWIAAQSPAGRVA